MNRRKFISDTSKYSFGGLFFPSFPFIKLNQIKISVKQLTQGTDHHFFGYIGQSLTIPWSKNGDRILCLSASFHDHLAGKGEPADVNIIYANEKVGILLKLKKLTKVRDGIINRARCFIGTPIHLKISFFLMIVIPSQEW
jgi:hypothetical protein